MMLSTVRGQFHEFEGTLEAAPDDPSNSRARGTAQVASIDTGNPERDAHLRSPEFFPRSAWSGVDLALLRAFRVAEIP